MYQVSAIRIDKNVYAIPTKVKNERRCTFCYIFRVNDFCSWYAHYEYAVYIEDQKLKEREVYTDELEMDSEEVNNLHDLWFWKDIEKYFKAA